MIRARHHGSRRRVIASVAVGALILSGAAVLGAGLFGSRNPSPDAGRTVATPRAGRDGSSTTTSRPLGGAALPASDPVRIAIPALGVDSSLLRLGTVERKLQLPHPASHAGWYDRSATPGSVGTSVIVGYIQAGDGTPAVFARLARLGPHDTMSVRRRDGRVVTYSVEGVRGYRPGTLPTEQIYAPTTYPSLRLITCGGAVRPGRPPENVVVSARLTKVGP